MRFGVTGAILLLLVLGVFLAIWRSPLHQTPAPTSTELGSADTDSSVQPASNSDAVSAYSPPSKPTQVGAPETEPDSPASAGPSFDSATQFLAYPVSAAELPASVAKSYSKDDLIMWIEELDGTSAGFAVYKNYQTLSPELQQLAVKYLEAKALSFWSRKSHYEAEVKTGRAKRAEGLDAMRALRASLDKSVWDVVNDEDMSTYYFIDMRLYHVRHDVEVLRENESDLRQQLLTGGVSVHAAVTAQPRF